MNRSQKKDATRRIIREQRTITAMLTIYCHARHERGQHEPVRPEEAHHDQVSADASCSCSDGGLRQAGSATADTTPHFAAMAALCPACREFLVYSQQRLACCPLAAAKPTCRACPIHCYAPEQKRQAKKIMRYAGPRMVLWHPLLALGHLWDELVSTCRAHRDR